MDRRRTLRRQPPRGRRDSHARRHRDRPAQRPFADRGLLLARGQHHPAAAGARLDSRPLRRRGRDPRLRPDHRLHDPRQGRAPRDLRLGRRRAQGARRVRLEHRPDRRAAARALRGGADAEGRGGRQPRPRDRRVGDALRGPHARRHPRARRQRPRRRAAVRGRGAAVGDQPRALPVGPAALGQGSRDAADGGGDAADASLEALLRDVRAAQSVARLGRRRCRARARDAASRSGPAIRCSPRRSGCRSRSSTGSRHGARPRRSSPKRLSSRVWRPCLQAALGIDTARASRRARRRRACCTAPWWRRVSPSCGGR